MSKEDREVVADWMMVAAAAALFASLFLTWSHQLSPGLSVYFGGFDPFRGVPRDPTAWQVYSAADVVLALLAVVLLAVALAGPRPTRIAALVASVGGLAFVVHAIGAPPSSGGSSAFRPPVSVPTSVALSPGAGVGETIALLALLLGIAGLALSLTAD
jgi:hypothetical protein